MSAFGDIALSTGEGAIAGSMVPGWGTAIGAGAGLAKGIYGAIESGKGPKRPPISANPYTQMALDLAKQEYANKGLTGNDILQNKLDNTTANYIQQAKSSNSGMDFITGLAGTMGAKYGAQNEIAYKGALEDKQDMLGLQQALQASAADKDRQDQWNIEGAYQDELARKKAQTEGMANAIGDLGSVTNSYLQTKQQNSFLNGLYGLNKPQVVNKPQRSTTAQIAPTNIPTVALSPGSKPFNPAAYKNIPIPSFMLPSNNNAEFNIFKKI